MRKGKRRTLALAAVAATLGVAYSTLLPTGMAQERIRTATPALSADAAPVTVPATWKLTFDPAFAGTRLNTNVWATCYLWAEPSVGCTNFGNADEREWYLPSQDLVSNGILDLAAERLPTPGRTAAGARKEYSCRSGMITSYPSFRFRYGYVQVTARIPRAAGLWSAFWLVDAQDRWPPEIDIMEHWGASDTGVYFHPAEGPRVAADPRTADLAQGWHTFAVSWTAGSLIWFIDGREVMFTGTHVPREPMYFIADLADYELPASGGCAGSLLVKSVKVWQP
jgi:beta-glucanase (GH16 family)